MKRRYLIFGLVLIAAAVLGEQAMQAQPGRRQPGQQGQGRQTQGRGERQQQEEEPPPLPTDERLLALHRQFVTDAERLAREYERAQNYDAAVDVYREILKLVPRYESAQERLDAILARQANAQQASFTVEASGGWQDTGITVLEGKPITIRADGEWTFTIQCTADGVIIPEELRDFNMGCLLGIIDDGNIEDAEAFAIGTETAFTASTTGRLYLCMYDTHPDDNDGEIEVLFTGTFQEAPNR